MRPEPADEQPGVDAEVEAPAAAAGVQFGQLGILMGTSLWISWARIAIRRADDAAAARASEGPDPLGVETQEAMSAICAVAFSMESLQRVLGTVLDLAEPEDDNPTAFDLFLTAFTAAIDLQPEKVAGIASAIKPVYRRRNSSVHYKEEMREPVDHPTGVSTSYVASWFNAESAAKAVHDMRRVYRTLLEHPAADLTAWVADRRHAIEPLM